METSENPEDVYEFELLDRFDAVPLECTSQPDYDELLTLSKAPFKTRLAKSRKKQITVGAVLQKEEIRGISKIPYVVSENKALEFKCGIATKRISVLGLTSLNYGYPILGEYGENVIEITVEYSDGKTDKHILKNGVDITLAYTSVGSSRVDPVAENATRLARFSYDKNFEEYIINRLDIPVQKKEIAHLCIKGLSPDYKVLIYGVYGRENEY